MSSAARRGPERVLASDFDPESLVATVVNRRYRLERVLHTTMAGALYQAVSTEGTPQPLVVRLLPPSRDVNHPPFPPDLDTPSRVSHPHLLATLKGGEIRTGPAAGFTYLVREEGSSAGGAALSLLESVRDVTRAVVDALSLLHRKGLVHGRVQPGNVLWHDGVWKLADFGLTPAGARTVVAHASAKHALQWHDPALLAGRVGPETDIWGLGVVLLHRLTGRAPYSATHPEQLLEQMLWQPPHLPCDLPAPFDLILHGCLQRNVDRRWSLHRVGQVLADVLYVPTRVETMAPREPEETPTPYRERKSWVLSTGADALLLSGPGDVVVAGSRSGEVSAWCDAKVVWSGVWPGPVKRLLWKSASQLVVVCATGTVHWVDAASGRTRKTVDAGVARIEAALLTPDGRLVLGFGEEGLGLVEAGKVVRTGFWPVYRLLADGTGVFTSAVDGTLLRWNAELNAPIASRVLHQGFIAGLADGPEGHYSAAHDGSIACWSSDLHHPQGWHLVSDSSVRCLDGSKYLAVAGHADGTATFLTPTQRQRAPLSAYPLVAVAAAANAPVVATVCHRGTLTLWGGPPG